MSRSFRRCRSLNFAGSFPSHSFFPHKTSLTRSDYSDRPAIIEDMSQSDVYIEALAKLDMVHFGGGWSSLVSMTRELGGSDADAFTGNLPREAGDRLVERGVYIGNVIAATE